MNIGFKTLLLTLLLASSFLAQLTHGSKNNNVEERIDFIHKPSPILQNDLEKMEKVKRLKEKIKELKKEVAFTQAMQKHNESLELRQKAHEIYLKDVEDEEGDKIEDMSDTAVKLEKEAIKYFKKAGKYGCPEGFYRAAQLYDENAVDLRDCWWDGFWHDYIWSDESAEKYYELDFEQKYVPQDMSLESTKQMAYKYYNKGIFDKAFYYYSLASNKGDVESMRKLAGLYGNGLGVDKNEQKALELLKKAHDLQFELSKQHFFQANNGHTESNESEEN